MGTPEFAAPSLRALVAAGHDVALVVTRPDRPRGRGLALEASPVKRAALDLGLDLSQPEQPNGDDGVARISSARPEALIVVAYGAILREALLGLAPLGAINVHASLLPKYRGMSPIQRAIWDGEPETGVVTMFMDRGVDTGDLILVEKTPIGPDETGGELHDRLAALGAEVLVKTLACLAFGQAFRHPQAGQPSYAARLEKKDGIIDWALPARVVHDRARALTPRPGATAICRGEPLLVTRTRVVEPGTGPAEGSPTALADPAAGGLTPDRAAGGPGRPAAAAFPGTIAGTSGAALRVHCAPGLLDILELRPAGKHSMSGADFARGRRLTAGDRFDASGPEAR